jgi:ABC-type lipoprotein export system ATPase subunit
MAETPPIVELVNVTKQYDPPGGGPGAAVLKGVTLSVAAGESLAIVGPSGSGKSTLLNIIGTLDRPTSGQVRLGSRNLAALGDDDLASIRRHEIGFIFQLHHLLAPCTALENVLVPALAEGGRVSAETEERARAILARVGLGERLTYRPGQLSGGERQRVAVARALINRPKLLLADEPTGALDREAAENLGRLLVELNREEGVTLVAVTHAPAIARLMGRVLELRDGQLVGPAQ